MKIQSNMSVAVTYDLYAGEKDERELMEQATVEKPLRFIYGLGQMLPAFEKNLESMTLGDKFDFELQPAEAYGEFNPEHIIDLPKEIFLSEGKLDTSVIKEGNTVPMQDSEGNRLMGTVESIADQTIKMNFNHPLAGETLHFSGSVIDVHEATAEEIAAINQPSCSGCGENGCESGGCESGGCNSGSCGC